MNKNLLLILEKIAYYRRRFTNPEKFCHKKFQERLGYPLNLENPKTFNEKMQWLKLYGDYSDKGKYVDKVEVKKIVSNILGKEYIIPTLAVYDNVSEINLDELPDKFVLKCTHDSASVVICNNKATFDFKAAKKKLKHYMKINYYYMGFEPVYKNIKPRIIAEKYIAIDGEDLHDYKFFCFNGRVKCFKIDFDRFTEHRANYYDNNGKLLPFGEVCCPPNFERNIDISPSLKKMISLVEKISSDKPFARVDLYDVHGKILFGEITFFPSSGFGSYTPDEWDNTLGSWLSLPEKEVQK